LMFSATMASKIRKLAKEILSDPDEISVAISKPADGVTQKVYLAHEEQKVALVRHILGDKEDFQAIIIFCSTKKKVEKLARTLLQKGYSCQGISSDYEQDAREEALRDFRSGKTRIMVATDVMSRGIDIKGIDLVINYDVPGDAEDYVHRIGRTARAKTEGMAITLVCADDMFKFSKIEQLIDRELEKDQPPTELGEGPSWRGQSRGKSGSKGGARNDRGPKREKPRRSKDEKSDRKPPRSKTEGDAPKREKKKREPSPYRLLYDALPNPKKGKPAGPPAPEVTE